MHSYPPHGEGVKAQSQSYPPQILPQNAKLSFPTILQILPILYVGEGFVPIMQNLYKSSPTNESLLGPISFFFFFFFFLNFSFYVYLI